VSKQRRGGLGRGIGALIPTAPPGGSTAGSATSSEAISSSVALDSRPIPGHNVVNSAPVISAPAVSVTPSATATTRSSSDVANPDTANSDSIETGQQAPANTKTTTEETTRELAEVPGATFAEIPIDSIRANTNQPRQVFDPEALAELTHSIREFGVLQPVVVRADGDNGYELVMGERRLRASQAAGLTEIPAIIRSTADDAMLRDALLENIHRASLNPLEEAAAYQQLLEEFGVTHEELARRIGRSRSLVSNTIRLLNLSVPVQRRVAAGVLSAGHARALLSLADSEQQDELAARIVAEGLSVRATEELVTLAARESPSAKRRGSTPRISAPGVADLADRLSDTFDTRVRVEIGKRKGKITVEFGSIDDLERIVAMMAPTLSSSQSA
jgi:ParB family chromosome partitioning protein